MRDLCIPVDFGNRDEDGAVRLVTKGTLAYLDRVGVQLTEGLLVTMTDDEVIAEGRCTLRDGVWVATINRWLQ